MQGRKVTPRKRREFQTIKVPAEDVRQAQLLKRRVPVTMGDIFHAGLQVKLWNSPVDGKKKARRKP